MVGDDPRYFSTGELSRRSGATPRAIRFYEENGLLAPHRKGATGKRRYTLEDLDRLLLITDLRDLDMSLEDIRQLLEIRDGCHSSAELGDRLGQKLKEQLDQTQRRLLALRRLREELAAAIATTRECVSCPKALEAHPCRECDNITRPESPRILKVLLGHCGMVGPKSQKDVLVGLRARRGGADGAQEP
jgi:DNA-binding transcriptional MerR regulator